MNTPNIEFVNQSTLITGAELEPIMAALQVQVSRDFAPIWGQDAKLSLRDVAGPLAGAWQLVFLDDADQADALGYHDLTAEGLPIGKVFVAADKRYGDQVSVTASHELLEMAADPGIGACIFVSGQDGDAFYALEVCDACERDDLGYDIDGVQVSDFVYPSWFVPVLGGSGQKYDFQGRIVAPLQLLAGGYIGVYRPGSGWSQVVAQDALATYRSRGHIGSRRERRRVPKSRWLVSTHP